MENSQDIRGFRSFDSDEKPVALYDHILLAPCSIDNKIGLSKCWSYRYRRCKENKYLPYKIDAYHLPDQPELEMNEHRFIVLMYTANKIHRHFKEKVIFTELYASIISLFRLLESWFLVSEKMTINLCRFHI